MTTVRDWLGEAGVVSQKRVLKDRRPYLHLFPRPQGKNRIVKRNNTVAHTVKFIPMMVKATLKQTDEFVDTMLAPTLKQTCENLWQWVFNHIRYTPDGNNERVRAPTRTAFDGAGDCDCMTGFLDSCLENVRKKTGWWFWIVNRITKYNKPNFQHIYPIVITETGEQIILDCVTQYFNYEEPYSEKEDNLMDLEYLNGFDDANLSEDALLLGIEEYNELGKLKILEKAGNLIKNTGAAIKNAGATIKEKFPKAAELPKKVVHAQNTVNPAALLLRNGFLAAMKTNMLNVAGRIKYAYLNEEQAKQRGFDMKRYEKLRKLRDRMEKTFYGTGGKPENLKEAILTGKGNASKDVAGIGLIPIYALQQEGTTVREIIGDELYAKANGALAGNGGLGAVLTAASVGTAAAAISALAVALKEIGVLKEGQPNTDNPDQSGASVEPSETAPGESDYATDNSTTSGDNERDPDAEPELLKDPIGWVKANPGKTALAAAVIVGGAIGVYRWVKSNKEQNGERDQHKTKRDRGYSRSAREEFTAVPLR